MSGVSGTPNQPLQNRIKTAVTSPGANQENQTQLHAARRNFHINDDRLSSFKVMEQLLVHMKHNVSFRGS